MLKLKCCLAGNINLGEVWVLGGSSETGWFCFWGFSLMFQIEWQGGTSTVPEALHISGNICTDERFPCQLHWTVYWKCLHRRHISGWSWEKQRATYGLTEGPGANFKSPNPSNALILHIWEFTLNAVSHHLVQMVLKGPTVVWYCQIQNFDRTTTVIHLKISNPLKAYWEFSVKNNSIKFH